MSKLEELKAEWLAAHAARYAAYAAYKKGLENG